MMIRQCYSCFYWIPDKPRDDTEGTGMQLGWCRFNPQEWRCHGNHWCYQWKKYNGEEEK